MRDLSSKKKASLIFDYLIFVQRNAVRLMKEGKDLSKYTLVDYLIEELNYTEEEALEIRDIVKDAMKKAQEKVNNVKSEN